MALSTIWALLHFWLLFTPAGTVEEDWSWYPGNSAARRSSKALNRSLRSRSHLLNWAAEATLKRIHTFKPVALILHKFFNLNWKAVEYYLADRTYSRRPCEEPVPRRTTLDDAMASTLEYIQIQFHQFLGKHWRFLKFFTIFMFLQFFFFTFLCFCSRAQIPLSFKIDETSQHQGSVTGLDEWVPSSRTACQTHSGSWKQLRYRRQSTRHKSRFWTAAAAVWGEGSKKGVIWIVPPPPFLGGH